MHHFDATSQELLDPVLARLAYWISMDDPPLDGTATLEQLNAAAPNTIGRGPGDPAELFRIVDEVLWPAIISVDSPRYFSFIPAAPSKASALFDTLVSIASVNGISWMDAAGAVWAENQALRVLSDAAGLPPGAGGCFVSGGSAGNLAGLAVARDVHRRRFPSRGRQRRLLTGAQAHASIINTARLLDLDVLAVPPTDPTGRLRASDIARVLADDPDPGTICAVAATAGTTNTGTVDELAGLADVAGAHDMWLHVDAAYGGAALLAPSARERFDGIERADSLVIDPHKWLFCPMDCGAVIYREPSLALATHRQTASYLDPIHQSDAEWNPSDYAHHLTRRARGLPLWFGLAVHGLDAYVDAVETGLTLARHAAEEVRRRPYLSLCLDPELSVVVFRRIGWGAEDYQRWSDELLAAQTAFVAPATFDGEPVVRMVFIHPATPVTLVDEILDSLGPHA